jgi:chemotaxis protein histidine kinase CheA
MMRGRLVGVAVDRMVGYREVVVKSLGKALKGMRGFAGVTILGDGSTVLILDLNTL